MNYSEVDKTVHHQIQEPHLSSELSSPYSALLTDLYQLTMAQAYFEHDMLDVQGCFHMFFRDNPFRGGYSVACGTSEIADIVASLHFSENDISYLKTIPNQAGQPLFSNEFLDYLANFEPQFDIDAVREGTIVFPREPLVRVMGPIVDCQLIETILLNVINFQTLVATKASRVCSAAQGGMVAEFGLRRAQGPNGGLAASRAAYVGGCHSTSNVLAGKTYGIPVSGTHAHSWVMAFPSELEAFRAYAQSMPDNCTLLVDTYSVETGVKHAITIARELNEQGRSLSGIRIDSGDLAELSKYARNAFDQAGFPEVKIIVSNDLDEYTVQSLIAQKAPIDGWGVGTKLATCFEQPALAGVYKVSAVKDAGEQSFRPVIKTSEQMYKLTIPGVLQTRRYHDKTGRPVGDMIVDSLYQYAKNEVIVDPMDATLTLDLTGYDYEELLVPLIRKGVPCATPEPLCRARKRAQEGLLNFDESVLRFMNPQVYPAGIESGLFDMRTQMVRKTRESKGYTWK